MVFYSSSLGGAGGVGFSGSVLFIPREGFSASSDFGSSARFLLNFIRGAIVGVYSVSGFGSSFLI